MSCNDEITGKNTDSSLVYFDNDASDASKVFKAIAIAVAVINLKNKNKRIHHFLRNSTRGDLFHIKDEFI